MAKNQNKYLQLTATAGFIGMFGVSFDGFWHLSLGRESFFVLPHLFVYGGVIAALYFSWQGYRATGQSAWKWLFRILCIIPLAAPIDELWHRWKGVETIDTPSIVWSPPHVLFLLAGMSTIMILAIMTSKSERLKSRNILGPALLGMFLNMLIIFVAPLLPMGPHQLIGASGIGVMAAGAIAVFFLARRLFPESGSATLTAAIFLLMQLIMWDASYYIPVQYSFLHIPDWLLVLVFIVPAYFMDSTDNTNSMTRGTAAGFIIGLLFFGLGGYFIPSSMFSYADLWGGTLAAAIGGMLAGLVQEHITTPEQKA
jgi:hypothetical protein